MTRRRAGTGGRATRKPVVVVAGEDANDRDALRVLMEARCPTMRGRIVEISDSVRLRSATGSTLKERVSTLRRKAEARAEREGADLACVFVHEDWDQVDGDESAEAAERVQVELQAQFGTAHYVLAVWEVEAWLFLFPAALTAASSRWSVPRRHRGKDTGSLEDPKKILKRECTSGNRYRENDAARVLDLAVQRNLVSAPEGRNRSWTSFCGHIAECCDRHLPRPGSASASVRRT